MDEVTPNRTTPLRHIGAATRRGMLVLLVVLGFGAGVVADRAGVARRDEANASGAMTTLPEFQTLQETWDMIHSDYVDESAIIDSTLLYGAAKGMVDALGDTGHSTFLTPEEADAYEASFRGELIGIGVELDFSGDNPVVITPIDGSPADVAGIRTNDVIVAIGQTSTTGASRAAISSLIQGDVGTSVQLTVERPSTGATLTFDLTRAKIEINPVTWSMLPDNVAQIRIAEFSDGTARDLDFALSAAKDAGATAIVLDLRDNPGGLVDEAIESASEFLPEGQTIYRSRTRDATEVAEKARPGGHALTVPMAVLVNGGTASAAEIVASALQENDRATTIGERTFGTGTVLIPRRLEDGSLLVLGTALWLTPNGEQLWHKGFTPAKVIDLPANAEPDRPSDDATVDATELSASDDTQLKQAVQSVTTP